MVGFFFGITLLVIQQAFAAPSISLPINSQVPPVAHASQHFAFAFSPSTFAGTTSIISYSLSGAPSWLSLDGGNRMLSGTPGNRDVGSTTFQLTAWDDTGSADMPVTLVVLDHPGPQLGAEVLPQLARVGSTSSPASLLLRPTQSFTLRFVPDTFTGTSSSTIYYATSGNNTPLPSWLQFNEQNLEFTGTAPPLVSPTSYPQVYPVRLVASDVPGFADATVAFQIVVGYDVLYFNVTRQTFNLQRGSNFQSPSLLDQLLLNGEHVSPEEITSVTSNTPNWFTLNTQNISFGGDIPNDAESQDILLSATDTRGDVANTSISLKILEISGSLFNGGFSTINATVGQPFSYTIGQQVRNDDGITISVNAGSAASWLSYDPSTRTLSGTVPVNNPPSGVQTVQITVRSGSNSETQGLPISIVPALVTSTVRSAITSPRATTRSASSSQASPSSSSIEPTVVALNDTQDHSGRNLAIVLGILLPLILLILLLLLTLFCIRRRKQERRKRSISHKQISAPIQTPLQEKPEADLADGRDRSDVEDDRRYRTPEHATQLDPLFAVDSLRKARLRMSKQRPGLHDSGVLEANFDEAVRNLPPKVPPRSPKRIFKRDSKASSRSSKRQSQYLQDCPPVRRTSSALNYSRKRIPLGTIQSRTFEDSRSAKRSSSRAMTSPLHSMSSDMQSRLSGMGHGNGGVTFGPPGYRLVRDSWHNTYNSYTSENDRMPSVDLGKFPRPPQRPSGVSAMEGHEDIGRASLRLVQSPSVRCSMMSEERRRYVRDRAIDRTENTPHWPTWSRPKTRESRVTSRGLGSQICSPEVASSTYGGDDLASRDTWQTYTKSPSMVDSRRPITIVSEDESATEGESAAERVRRPPPLRLKDPVSSSSGQFDTAVSSSEDNWEVDELEEAFGSDGHRRWQVSTNSSPMGSPLERPLDFGEAGLARMAAVGRPRAYTPPTNISSYDRRFALGDRVGKRPISVTEGDLQRSYGSHSGRLAFV